jgi:hypothetical protein
VTAPDREDGGGRRASPLAGLRVDRALVAEFRAGVPVAELARRHGRAADDVARELCAPGLLPWEAFHLHVVAATRSPAEGEARLAELRHAARLRRLPWWKRLRWW